MVYNNHIIHHYPKPKHHVISQSGPQPGGVSAQPPALRVCVCSCTPLLGIFFLEQARLPGSSVGSAGRKRPVILNMKPQNRILNIS